MALAGGLAVSGTAERPVMAHPPTADFASGLQTALAVCGALIGRGRTGTGTFLDLSLAETVLAWQSPTLTQALRPGFAPALGASLLNGGAAYYQIYRAADGRFVTLGAIEEKFWRNFCVAVGQEDWIARQGEAFPQTALIGALSALFATKTAAQWEDVAGHGRLLLRCRGAAGRTGRRIRRSRRAGMVVARDDATIEALFPAWVDGQPPAPPRRAPVMSEAATVLATLALTLRGGRFCFAGGVFRPAPLPQGHDMSWEFLVTSFIVVVSPGTGVLLHAGGGAVARVAREHRRRLRHARSGIVPHIAAAILGLAAILHTSAARLSDLQISGRCVSSLHGVEHAARARRA